MMTPEQAKQLRDAYNQATRGIWAFTEQEEGFGLFCNEVTVAQKMSFLDAYLVDTMHYHFIPLIDQVDKLTKDVDDLKQTEDKLTLENAALELQVQHYKNLHEAAIRAGEQLAEEHKGNGTK